MASMTGSEEEKPSRKFSNTFYAESVLQTFPSSKKLN